MLPSNINREHLLLAIAKIDADGVPPGGQSSTYDVIFESKRYPPKLVVSLANLFANGSILDRNMFEGGADTECFSILKSNGFEIKKKTEPIEQLAVWVEKTIVKGRKDRETGERALGKALWSPRKSDDGKDIYKNMRLVKPGDFVLHLADNEAIVGISQAASSYTEADGLPNTAWSGPAYIVPLQGYTSLEIPINRSDILIPKFRDELLKIKDQGEVFYNKDIDLRQGAYLTPSSEKLTRLINNVYFDKTGKSLPLLNMPLTTLIVNVQDNKMDNGKDNKSSLNTILYGPPGTGKTYSTIDHACDILGFQASSNELGDDLLRQEKRNFFEQHIGDKIEFITFHQSYSYEDFIEGIKPAIGGEKKDSVIYETQAGIFLKIAFRALKSLFSSYKKVLEMPDTIDFSSLYKEFINNVTNREMDPGVFTTKTGSILILEEIANDLTLKLRFKSNGSKVSPGPGTRMFFVNAGKIKLLFENNVSKDVQSLAEVHPFTKSGTPVYYAVYKDFIEFVEKKHPDSFRKNKDLKKREALELNIESFKSSKEYEALLDQVSSLSDESELPLKVEPYILVIDEINRGNVAQIFGELITLIEEDKRFLAKEELRLTLQYSKSQFSVPPNLYILGTMNTADRSVEALDTALRRRFSFIDKGPDVSVLKQTEDGIDLSLLLNKINARLEVLLDADHTIGHGWLIDCKNAEQVKTAFERKIFPLLKEFFYNDYSKIGLVLGQNFITVETKKHLDLFASFTFDVESKKELASKPVYKIAMPQNEELVKAFQSIYQAPVKLPSYADN